MLLLESAAKKSAQSKCSKVNNNIVKLSIKAPIIVKRLINAKVNKVRQRRLCEKLGHQTVLFFFSEALEGSSHTHTRTQMPNQNPNPIAKNKHFYLLDLKANRIQMFIFNKSIFVSPICAFQ